MKQNSYIGRKELLFFAAWIVFLIALILDRTMWAANSEGFTKLLQLVRYGAYGICFVEILLDCFEQKRILVIGVLIVVTVLSYFGSKNKTMVLYLLLFLAAHEISARLVLAITTIIQAVLLFGTVFCSQIGIAEDHIFEFTGRIRHGLGFSWTTTAAVLYFYMSFAYVCVRNKKITYIELAVMEVINFYFFKTTDSKMVFYLGTLGLVFWALMKLLGFRFPITKAFRHVVLFAPTVVAAFSVAIHKFYVAGNPFWDMANKFLNTRLRLGNEGIKNYGIHLFGNQIEWVGYTAGKENSDGYNYVDCSYLQILLEYGLVFFAVVILIYTILLYKAIKSENYIMVWCILFILVFGITEPRLMNLSFNPFPVLFLCNYDWSKRHGKAEIT